MKSEPPTIRRLAVPGLDARIHAFRCGDIVDSFALLTERFTIIIDTLISPQSVAQVLEDLDGNPIGRMERLLVVNTHGDWDHCWGNALFDGPAARFPAPVVGHAKTRQTFDQPQTENRLTQSRVAHPGWYDDVEIRLPTVEIEGRAVIRGGDLTLELIPTPGHTPDHISVWIPELKVLFAGDAAELPMPFVGESSSLPVLRRSLHAMLELDPAMVLYCHGGDITSPDLIRHNIWYFDEAERRCHAHLATGSRKGPISPGDLGWPLEAALPDGTALEQIDADFYRRSHDRAVRAVAKCSRSQIR